MRYGDYEQCKRSKCRVSVVPKVYTESRVLLANARLAADIRTRKSIMGDPDIMTT